MALETARGVSELEIVLNAGVDEIAASTSIAAPRPLKMVNFRVSKDGSRIEKRQGLTQVTSLASANSVYGYGTYFDGSSNFCQIAVTATKIYRKIGSAAWAEVHTWASPYISHPVKIQEIQGRIYVLTEVENVMITSAGTKVQAGITAPTTIPTLTAGYEATLLNEDCAVITDWADEDAGAGASSQATFDSRSTMRLLNTGVAGDMAKRTRTVGGFGSRIGVEITMYINTIGIYSGVDYFEFDIYNGHVVAKVRIDQNDIYVYSGVSWVSAGVTVYQDKWFTLKFLLDTETPGEEFLTLFRDNVAIGDYWCKNPTTATPGKIEIFARGSTAATDVYVDSIIVGSAGTASKGGNLAGQYRYAVAYRRSGDYYALSNPIKCLIGADTFTGTGLNDLTPGGTYTGDITRTIRVQIDGTGTPDTFKWSEDGGSTWVSTAINLATKNYLNYGIELTWGATTGHTLADYWEFTVSALAVSCNYQKVTLASIPVSSDAQVDTKDIYRTQPGGVDYYLVATIPNAQTTYVDNIGDWALGLDMKEDCEIPPKKKISVWWDDRLWILDTENNVLYYSETDKPDHFDSRAVGGRWISVRMGKVHDVCTGMIPYKGNLYVFKKHSIFVVRKNSGGAYGRYEVCGDFGAVAGHSLLETYGLLTFLSYRGWEVFNGCEGFANLFGLPITPSTGTITSTYYDLISAANNREYNEIWATISDRSSGTETVMVCNYLKGQCFYFFKFHKTPSLLVEARDSSGAMHLYMGTRDGFIFQCDYGSTDDGTAIDAYARTGWIKTPIKYTYRRFEIEYELPTSYALTTTFYYDFQETAGRTVTHTGATPSGGDTSIRLPIKDQKELFINAQYFAVKIANAEATATAKVNTFKLIMQPKFREEKIAGS